MSGSRYLHVLELVLCLLAGWGTVCRAEEAAKFGPLYDRFRLTLAPEGHRTEMVGPLFYSEQRDSTHTWAVPPLLSHTSDPPTDSEEFDFLYPLLTYDRFGSEYRFQFFQVFAFAGGGRQSGTNVHRFTLFPIFFRQRSAIPEENYTAVLPFYGHLKNRLFRDEVKFIMLPLYVQSRKGEVVTDNYVYPIYHRRHGPGLHGWQVWPIVGKEHKDITTRTNHWGDAETVPGHDKFFAAWPIYLNQTTGIGTTNVVRQQAVLPLYSRMRSPLRDSTTYFWPFGVTITDDREKRYHEVDAPWPLVVFAHGEGKTAHRVWPFFSQVHSPTKESDFYLWPVYKYNRLTFAPLDRERTRILFFLYSDITERNTESGTRKQRVDFWPFYTFRRDYDGNQRLQVLSLLEPFLPASKSIERDYSPLWALWRSEKNGRTGAASQSLLWNLYRRERAPDTKKISLLFGLFQYHSAPDGKRWRLFYIPIGKQAGPEPARAPVRP